MLGPFTSFCYGVAFAGACGVGLFFLRFWRVSGDPFFLWFASAFGLLAVQWMALVGINPSAETRPYYYLLRLLAFLFIIVAALQKTRQVERHATRPPHHLDSSRIKPRNADKAQS
jgi:hypothetical protein